MCIRDRVGDVERVLVFTPADTPSDCADILTERGCSVTTAAVYRTRYLPQEALELRPEDYVVFTSASTVKGFVQSMDMDDFHEVTAVCIGEKTVSYTHLDVYKRQQQPIDNPTQDSCEESDHDSHGNAHTEIPDCYRAGDS